MRRCFIVLAGASCAVALPAAAQEKQPTRVRVGLGPQLGPAFPGAKETRLRPPAHQPLARQGRRAVRLRRAGRRPRLPDHPRNKRLTAGPAFRLEGRRDLDDAGGGLTPVGRTVEVGAFMAAWPTEWLRLRGDIRKGLGGHGGWVSTLGADYVARDGDKWLFSIGPRVTLADGKRERAYFGVDAASAARTGLPVYTPGSRLKSAGATGVLSYALTPRWRVQGQVQYARLVDDAGRSPVIRRIDSQDQLRVGAAVTCFTIR
ncbi:MipA/OmpV family protein [Sphingomonas sp. MMS24-JH45]